MKEENMLSRAYLARFWSWRILLVKCQIQTQVQFLANGHKAAQAKGAEVGAKGKARKEKLRTWSLGQRLGELAKAKARREKEK